MHWVVVPMKKLPATRAFGRLGGLVEMAHRVHALVKHTHDFDHIGIDDSIVDEVHRCSNAVSAANVADMETAQVGDEIVARFRCRTRRVLGDGTERRREERGVASLALFAPAIEAGREDRFEIALRRSGEPEASHRVSGYAFSAVVMG